MTSIILSNCKQTTKITANLLKSSNVLGKQYATLKDYKIIWMRPEKVSHLSPEKSGDLGVDIDIKKSDIPKVYSESSELQNASDIVKKMFTLEFLPKEDNVETMRTKFVDLVQRYNNDVVSPEIKIAELTSNIYRLREAHNKDPKNGQLKIKLTKAIDKRRKYLTKLRKQDYRCFEYTLEKLNLVYKPIPEPPIQITYRESLTRLTEKHCNQLVQQKLDAYKAELKAQQKDFYAEKAEKLAFIREEEIACGLSPTVSEEDIALAKQKVTEYQT